MILKIKNKGLRLFWERGETRALNQNQINRIIRIMYALDQAHNPADMNFPGFYLHPLKGEYHGQFAVKVSENWRIVYRFDGRDATDIDLIDYH